MPLDRLHQALATDLADRDAKGILKGAEDVIVELLPADGERGPRFRLDGHGDRLFIKMNANGYLGMGHRHDVIAAEEATSRAFGTGPGAVRFISGTYQHHIDLERDLAAFHGRDAGMIFSSAYAAIVGTLVSLISKETAVISDALNHNCIINAIRLARPTVKSVYPHNDMKALDAQLTAAHGTSRRVIVVTDGIFSMRGDHAPLDEVATIVRAHDDAFPEGVVLVVDDSHGVGAFGHSGRGTEEYTGAQGVDILVATLGKALGVNGGYVVGSQQVVDFLRESAPTYIYSNPITPAEASAARQALSVLDSAEGLDLLRHLRTMTARFEKGLVDLGFETIPGEHPVVPLMVRDTARTSALVAHLHANGVLATGLNFPVVPKGDEEIRFQVSAEHTPADIDFVLGVLAAFSDQAF